MSPTGALDTKTSEQIMDLLSEIAKDRLVIMVTHNPELAETYSNRIVSLRDGKIIDDTNPYVEYDEEKKEIENKKTNMSFFTALSLSFNNLLTKKGRTLITAFAGSIGIIGIALILSLSNGVQSYIDKVQADTMTSYPLSIERESVNFSNMITVMAENNERTEHENDAIYSNDIMVDMISSVSSEVRTNNLIDFKKYIEENKKEIDNYTNDIKYVYNLDLQIYSSDTTRITRVNPSNVMSIAMNGLPQSNTKIDVFTELSNNKNLLKAQYDIVKGKLPEKYDELVLIIDENNEISDYTLYSLGLKSQEELMSMMQSIYKGEEVKSSEQTKIEYDEILNTEFKLVLNSDVFDKVEGIWIDKSLDQKYMKKLLNDSLTLKIVGIIKPNEDTTIETAGGIGYTSLLSEFVINGINESEIVKEQKNNQSINIFTNKAFELGESIENNFRTLGVVDLDNPSIINIYPSSFASKDSIKTMIEEYNFGLSEEDKIEYTDYVGILMSSVTTIIDIISYVLISFVSISLIVSSIMIGIITYISVLERTKEIGILRAIGASKKDIRRVFNAETFIVGFVAGIIGVVVTIILNVPINKIIYSLSGINVGVNLPMIASLILVVISLSLTMIAGLIPSRFAAKKDPVEALRTE